MEEEHEESHNQDAAKKSADSNKSPFIRTQESAKALEAPAECTEQARPWEDKTTLFSAVRGQLQQQQEPTLDADDFANTQNSRLEKLLETAPAADVSF